VVELWFYTPAVGGSIPSAPTSVSQVKGVTGQVANPRCANNVPAGWQCQRSVTNRRAAWSHASAGITTPEFVQVFRSPLPTQITIPLPRALFGVCDRSSLT
jgi:hypothetical protein